MSDNDLGDFLATTLARQTEADSALHNGDPAEPYTLRVTHVYRRENGEWKIAHRHADTVEGSVPLDQGQPDEALTT